MIGKTLAHYEVTERLGSGGMGDVYRARDTKLNRDVAIKVLPEEFSRDAGRRKRFVREAQAIAALKHPNIAAIREAKLTVAQDEKDLFEGPNNLENLAGVYALIGRDDDAIDILEQLLDRVYESSITPDRLQQERVWDTLRDKPRFQALLRHNI